MQVIKCTQCGNTKNFYERMSVIQENYFRQTGNGNIRKVGKKQINNSNGGSRIYCLVCNEEIEEYNLFLDRYTETLFK